jgi:diaminopropionate ammonia-lyase
MRHVRIHPALASPRAALDPDGALAAHREITSWPGYEPTPLRELPALARRLGLLGLHYKDEAGRFGMGSFKALGGAYAVFRVVERRVQGVAGPGAVRLRDLMAGAYREEFRGLTVTTATDGNHGRSVAWGAGLLGCRAVIFVPASVSGPRRLAISRLGARVVVVEGDYDAAVRRCAAEAEANGFVVVSDTTYEGYLDIPRDVMQGYRVMLAEALEQSPPGVPFTHAFVQGGVGALAAAVAEDLAEREEPSRPRVIVVEPDAADCLYRSALAGRPTRASGDLRTVMGGLACGEPSVLAWEILASRGADFVTIPDAAALEAMRSLAVGEGGDPPIVAGESGAAGIAALLEAARHREIFRALGLSSESAVLVFGTEGATDPEIYRRIVGPPEP